jgi:hypothetical protein
MLIKELEKLVKPTISGFQYKKEIKGFSWTKKLHDRQEVIDIGYRTYYPNMFQLYTPFLYIYFNEVETILGEYLKEYDIKNIWGISRTIQRSLRDIEGIDYSKFETKIHDEESFQIVAEEIKKIIEYGAMPFFEKYSTLESVANLLSDKKPEEIVPYIQGAILFPKTILILKLAKHTTYEEKLIEFREALAIYAKKKEIYKQILMIYDDLFSEDLKGF